jgi:hypothetical protein
MSQSSIRTRKGYKDRLSRIVKDEKAKRNARIFELWMACHTQEEIATLLDCPRQTITDQIDSFADTVLENQSGKINANHTADFGIPIYNIWKQQITPPTSTSRFTISGSSKPKPKAQLTLAIQKFAGLTPNFTR